jgi:hypothetical protein
MASQIKNWNLSRWTEAADQTQGGSKLSSLTNPLNVGKIQYLTTATAVACKSPTAIDAAVTGIVFSIGRGTAGGSVTNTTPATEGTGSPWWDPQHTVDGGLGGKQNNGPNQLGDPAELNYSLVDSDFRLGTVEQDGGAQKFVNALLDSAYVAYNSGVGQGSGLTSMTVSRGNLSLTNSTMSGISGIVNTYSRSYSVTFNYKQSGNVENGAGVGALPDITNDLYTEPGNGPF